VARWSRIASDRRFGRTNRQGRADKDSHGLEGGEGERKGGREKEDEEKRMRKRRRGRSKRRKEKK
jgi:hypothetical protein